MSANHPVNIEPAIIDLTLRLVDVVRCSHGRTRYDQVDFRRSARLIDAYHLNKSRGHGLPIGNRIRGVALPAGFPGFPAVPYSGASAETGLRRN